MDDLEMEDPLIKPVRKKGINDDEEAIELGEGDLEDVAPEIEAGFDDVSEF
jgi:hypothetical protein